jgi:hypothetical protein
MSAASYLLHVSDHGYGHAARCGVLAAALLGRPEVGALAIAVPSLYRPFFAAAAADPRCRLLDLPTDLGIPLRRGEILPDPAHVARELDSWVRRWPALADDAIAALGPRPLDGVIADASPLALVLAARLGVPAIAVTNFEWHAQYVGLGLAGAAVDAVGAAYAGACAHLRYPFSLPSAALAAATTTDVPACARSPEPASVAELMAALPPPRILVTLGGLFDLAEPIRLGGLFGTVIFTKGLRVEAPHAARTVDLSAGFVDALPYLGAADLVVTKAGWSTVAEAAAARRPLLVAERPSVPEDRHVLAAIERGGLGRRCRFDDLAAAIERAIVAGLAPTPGIANDPAAVAAACVARLS